MQQEHSIWKHGLKFGGFLSVFMILITVISYLSGVDQQNNPYGFIGFILLFLGIVFSILQYRNTYLGGYIAFGKAFSTGFVTGVLAALIVSIFLYLFYSFVATDALNIDEDAMVQKLQETNPDMSEEMMEMSIKYAKKFLTPFWVSFMSLFWNVGWAALFSLLGALITKKNAPLFESNADSE